MPADTVFWGTIEVTLSLCNSAEMRFPTMGNDGKNDGGFRPVDSSQRNCGTSFDTQDRETLGSISRVKDLNYDESGDPSEKIDCSPQQETVKSSEMFQIGKSSVPTPLVDSNPSSTFYLYRSFRSF